VSRVVIDISTSPAHIITGDWEGGSVRFSPAVQDETGRPRAIPRLRVTMPSLHGHTIELLELDSRYLTVTHGERVYAWPTEAVGEPRRAEDLDTVTAKMARTVGHPLPGPGGRIVWGDVSVGLYGTAGASLTDAEVDEVLAALSDFLVAHPAVPAPSLGGVFRSLRQRHG